MVITIAGSFGSGGKHIAKRAAELLSYRFCDDEIIAEAVKGSDVDMPEETFRFYDESAGSASIEDMRKVGAVQRTNYFGVVNSLVHDVLPLDRGMDQLLRDVLTRLANEGDCVLLGRCANYYLEGRDDVISAFVVNEEENCLERIMEHYPDLSEKEARRLIKKTNKRREDYYSFFTGKRWGDMTDFDLVLNSKRLGIEGAAKLLQSTVAVKSAGR